MPEKEEGGDSSTQKKTLSPGIKEKKRKADLGRGGGEGARFSSRLFQKATNNGGGGSSHGWATLRRHPLLPYS